MVMHVVGLFDDATDAQAVARDLEVAGFDSGNIELHRGDAGGIVSRLTGVGVPAPMPTSTLKASGGVVMW